MPERADEPPFDSDDEVRVDRIRAADLDSMRALAGLHVTEVKMPPSTVEPPFGCTCDYECEGRTDDTDCPKHGRRDEPPFDSTQGVAYEGPCPRCGADLDAPDDNLDRHCPTCAITVRHATVTFEVIPDVE